MSIKVELISQSLQSCFLSDLTLKQTNVTIVLGET
jgi:hypothetical protein